MPMAPLPRRDVMLRSALALFLVLAASPAPAAEVMLEHTDLVPIGKGAWFASGLTLPDPDPALPALGPNVPPEVARQLTPRIARGEAQGFSGVLYDNRDRAHSALAPGWFPRLARLSYGPELKTKGADYGLAGGLVFPAVVFGNSSTAVTGGPIARSLPRLAMTSGHGPAASARLYRNNHLYVYPEHNDHDASDRFPANWPYMVISQGSSYTDRVFLEAIGATLAAFPPETFELMRKRKLVAPTVQMILRRNLAGVRRTEDYLSAAAHPVVMRGKDIRAGLMVAQAAALSADAVPPVTRLSMLEDGFRSTAGLAGQSEVLFDTPQALARIWRGPEARREMVVSTVGTVDPNGRDLTFSWHLIQGDPARVQIEPLDAAGRTARLRIDWHDPWETTAMQDTREPGPRQLSRVDIAVFADNGVNLSAPSFISVDFPEHQTRRYAPGPDGQDRLVSVDYDALGRKAPYDPLLFWSAPWTDTALYSADGALTGWERQHGDGREERVELGTGRYTIEDSGGQPALSFTPD
ncbi:hypothetical protein R3X27_22920 [Tropicimonas sp. TH_r6]|uniref:hypothetical protein n=1 Tax=Tropicimonas sp. TH_r6 TaxID=3082085 RepID=UPI00295322BF|nr:hypothetical protein [Tropicimonas sp. TH_r6]MDV7145549.1 hypothetical protein [Tropicimonas sp. TH_r6]